MSAISPQGVKTAFLEADKYRSIKMAEREYNIHHNDGMTLQIPQDNLLDWFVNTFDSHRIKLETKNFNLVKKNAGTTIKKNMATLKLMMKERDISQLFGFFSSSDRATSAENIRD